MIVGILSMSKHPWWWYWNLIHVYKHPWWWLLEFDLCPSILDDDDWTLIHVQESLMMIHCFLMLWQSGNPLMMYWNNCLPSFWDTGRNRDFAPTTTTNHYLTLGQSRSCSISWNYRWHHSSHLEYSSSTSGFKLITKSDSVNPWVQVVLSPFRPLHPLLLDRRSTRPASTEIPRFWSALSWIMVPNWKWESPPASTTLSYPFAIL